MDLQLAGRGRSIFIALAAAAAVALFALVASALGVRTAEAAPVTTTAAPLQTTPEASVAAAGIATVPPGGVQLWAGPDRDPFFTIAEGLKLPFLFRSGDWLLVTTTCDATAWVNANDVAVQDQATPAPTGPGFDVSQATIVLDPGHGARDWGGVGPTGLTEKETNLDIAERVRDLMATGRDVDWTSGAVSAGSAVPAFGSVVLTRDRAGPNGGDFEAGLGYRSTMATAAGADVYVSIHDNTVPQFDTDIPGSEVYYSIGAEGSDRLAGLIYEELLRSFEAFHANWRGGELLGARARIDPETGDDYYGVLRRATMPAVIVEGVYISEADEEALLATPEFRQAYAEAVYRGIVRFLTTDDSGAAVNPPEMFQLDAGTVTGNGCELPAQPGTGASSSSS
jgi:N-acetylmuramoyl-L-alanine amidase